MIWGIQTDEIHQSSVDHDEKNHYEEIQDSDAVILAALEAMKMPRLRQGKTTS